MNRNRWQELVDELDGVEYRFGVITPTSPVYWIEFDAGLTDAEVAETEELFGFRFSPDLLEFLQTAFPRGPKFPDWRSGDEDELREWLDLPRQGILFDVEHSGFWLEEWGPRPGTLDEALRIASELVVAAPRLIPIYGHRMMPDEPHLQGNPVFSVHGTDIIIYGLDLENYLRREFGLRGLETGPENARQIRFWDLDQFQEVRWADGACVFDNGQAG
ncbi:MAG: hypothetical protein ACJ76N_11415 [Thermoanaerobaculia bacterium]